MKKKWIRKLAPWLALFVILPFGWIAWDHANYPIPNARLVDPYADPQIIWYFDRSVTLCENLGQVQLFLRDRRQKRVDRRNSKEFFNLANPQDSR